MLAIINKLIYLFQSALGTNPFSVAAPSKDGDAFVLEMSTTAVAVGKVCVLALCIILMI